MSKKLTYNHYVNVYKKAHPEWSDSEVATWAKGAYQSDLASTYTGKRPENTFNSNEGPQAPAPTSTPEPSKTSASSGQSPDPYAGFAPKGGSSPTGTTDPNAVQLYEANDAVRLEIANLLKSAGYNVPVSGKYSDDLVNAYTDAVQKAAIQSQRLGRSFTVREYLNQERVNQTGTGGDSGITNYISDPTQAAGTIQSVFQGLFNREATDKEVDALTKILVDAQKKNPYKTKDGVRTGGIDDKQFLIDVIKAGTYEANKKAFPGILANLAKEAEEKKAGAEEKVRLTNEQSILDTALSNGLQLSDAQVKGYLAGVKAGKSIEEVQQEIRNIASLGQPESVAKMIQSGTDLDTIYQPYRSRMATVLEIPVDKIDINDASLRAAISPEGPSTLYDFEKNLRKDQRWQYTDNARSEASDIATKVLKDFGFMG